MGNSKASKKVKILSGISLFIADKGGDLLENKIMLLLPDDSPGEKLAAIVFDTMDEIVIAISDNDASNGEQVRKVLFDAVHDKVRPFLMELTQPVLDRIKSPDDKAVVSYLRELMNESLGILTDDEEKNAEQFGELFTLIRKSDQTKQVVLYHLILNRLFAKWQNQPDKVAYIQFAEALLGELWALVQAVDEDEENVIVQSIEQKLSSILTK